MATPIRTEVMAVTTKRPAVVTTTPATQLPVTLEEARRQLRAEGELDDALVEETLIPAATRAVETFLNRRLMPQTVELRLDGFPFGGFGLEVDPIRSINSVKYYDENNADQTLSTSAYEADLTEFRAYIRPASGYAWPNTYDRLNCVRISVEVGWASADDIPRDIRYAVLMMVAHMHENPEPVSVGSAVAEIPLGYASLLWPHRVVPV